jgi:protein-S-isoprenylcysteine O-methyltransferase Ste14
MRLLSIVSLLSYITYVCLLSSRGYDAGGLTTLGLGGFTISIVVFWWAVANTRLHRLRLAYTNADPDMINTSGPYAYVRHPFYLSYIAFWISTALVAQTWQWAPALTLALWYVRIARDEERRFRASALSSAYDTYRQRTGMLFPRILFEIEERPAGRIPQRSRD